MSEFMLIIIAILGLMTIIGECSLERGESNPFIPVFLVATVIAFNFI